MDPALLSMLNSLLELETHYILAILLGVAIHTFKQSMALGISIKDMWLEDRIWSLTSLVVVGGAVAALQASEIHNLWVYIFVGYSCNDMANNPTRRVVKKAYDSKPSQ